MPGDRPPAIRTPDPRHHTLAHDARYQLKAGINGKVTFSRRT